MFEEREGKKSKEKQKQSKKEKKGGGGERKKTAPPMPKFLKITGIRKLNNEWHFKMKSHLHDIFCALVDLIPFSSTLKKWIRKWRLDQSWHGKKQENKTKSTTHLLLKCLI